MPDNKETATRVYEEMQRNGGDLRAAVDAVAGPQETPEVTALRGLQDERTKLAGGTAPGEEPKPDPMDSALAAFHEQRGFGHDRTTSQTAAYQRIFDAAVAGDERIVFPNQAASMRAWRRKHGEAW